VPDLDPKDLPNKLSKVLTKILVIAVYMLQNRIDEFSEYVALLYSMAEVKGYEVNHVDSWRLSNFFGGMCNAATSSQLFGA
jgi:hypothetical protein